MEKRRLRDRRPFGQSHTAKEDTRNRILLVPRFREDDKGLSRGIKTKFLYLSEPLFFKFCKMASYEFKYANYLAQCLAHNW